ncbi:MAG: hypothetical protein A2428_10130 [Bdellovibrionales bacterium RIFOXYC1_FULL_54_43]|nr:MAG: hypothetical protein A2428_10130 [Bdellovibrionales bacterium RIFOXYC1_FULL_54_43]OFZ80549.1 MAG: hypothetical protein A2603_13225 [Bdellovibrionales bacterium RIFOXYD1_FULL_55_31]
MQKRTTTTYSQFTLKGNNLVLRDFREKDLPTYAKWLEPGHEWQNFDGPYYRQTLPAINPRLEKRKLMIESNSFPEPRMQVVIADINTDTLIGEANCYWNSAEIFWMSMGIDIFNSSLWGKGYGREALTLWIQYLFDAHPKLARLGLETWSGNHGMIKLALRLGFKEEARIRKARIVNGERYDALTFGLLREEWK